MKECPLCAKEFKPKSPHHFFCSVKCCGAYNVGKTWDSYFRKLIQKSPNRKGLTVEVLKDMLEDQEGLCALSGIPLTKIMGTGNISTNASIDRINAGGPYTKKNIRLVCHYLNSFRGQVSDGEFLFFCRRVTLHNGK